MAVLVVVVISALAVAFVLRESRGLPGATSSPTMSLRPSPTPSSSVSTNLPRSSATTGVSASPASSVPPPTSGSITGVFGYPSDFIPPLTVYAINVADPKVFFSVDFAGVGNPPRPTLPPGVSQPTYTITGISPGTYFVLAYRNDNNPGIGVYTQYTVKCQQATQGGQFSTPAPSCAANDQSLLPVTVHAGETVSRIDITDWQFQQTGYPERPR
jgi:hypothetical protein